MPSLRIALLLAILCAPIAASAGGDVCLYDSANQTTYVLKKLRIPKKTLDAVPVGGFMINGSATAGIPLSGTLLRQTTGQLIFGLTQHVLECVVYMNVNATLTGQVHLDCDLNGAAEVNSTVAPIDCGLVF
jgi:hypothetical protein